MQERSESGPRTQPAARGRYKMAFVVSWMASLLIILLDTAFASQFMALSVRLSVHLQKLPLTALCVFLSYVAFFAIFGYVLFIYTIRRDLEANLIMTMGVTLLIYAQALFKLALVDLRPVFLDADLNDDFCVCDYGKPSGHSLCSAGILLFIYDDLQTNFKLSRAADWTARVSFGTLALFIGLSRIYLGAHSFNQVIMGFSIGITLFFLVKRWEDVVKKFLLWPLIYKERYKDKKAVVYLLCITLLMNYVLLLLWGYRYSKFEVLSNQFFKFSNCFPCIVDFDTNFSVKIMREGLIFNIFFGMLMGIYMMKGPIYEYSGLYFDKNLGQYVLRVVFLGLFCSPLILIVYPKIPGAFFSLIKAMVISFIVGFMLTHPFISFVRKLGDSNVEAALVESDVRSSSSVSDFDKQEIENQLEKEEIARQNVKDVKNAEPAENNLI